MIYTALTTHSISSFAGAKVVSAAPINAFIEDNGLSDEDVAIMELVEEQVGKHGSAEGEERPVSARRGFRPLSDLTRSLLLH